MSERKDFEPWQVAIVYREQDGVCKKCGNPLEYGFHRHHKDGNPANNATTNLELHCPQCHGGEMYATLRKKKEEALGEVEAAIKQSLDGKASGAATEKLLDAIKLGLGLTNELYGREIEKPPAEIRMQNYLISSGILLKEFENGVRKGLILGLQIVTEVKKGKI